jgi:hypothetical protein
MSEFRIRCFNTLKRRSIDGSPAIMLAVLSLLWFLTNGPTNILALAPASTRTYTTNFPLIENPIAENGNWINGAAVGLEWSNVRTAAGLAFGTQTGTATGNAVYADSTAVLTGTWGADQEASATVYVGSAPTSSSVFEEVELRLRTTVTANSITGYEINCSVSTANNYLQIVRWNGPLNNWTQIDGREQHCKNLDTIKATIKGSTISVYYNGTLIMTDTDSTFRSGSPGIGFYLQGATGTNANYGFSSFSADDGSGTAPSPPVNLKGTVR